MNIPFLRTKMAPLESWASYLDISVSENRFSNFGPLHQQFCDLCEERYAASGYGVVLVSNATLGLTAVLMALDIRGAVVVPSFTFPATLEAVIMAGCLPILCDADPSTWEMSVDHLAALLSKQDVAAVMPVRSFGLVRPQDAVLAQCRRHGCPVVFDAAAAFGHPDRAAKIGSGAEEIEVFSLHATKVFSIGEGGLVFAPKPVCERLRATINFGFQADRTFVDGGNMKVDEVRCAIGLAELKLIDDIVAARTLQANAYLALFGRFPDLMTMPAAPGPTPWQTFPVRLSSHNLRNVVADRFLAAGIETRPYYSPSLSNGYRGRFAEHLSAFATPTADLLSEQTLCFPIYESMTRIEHDYLLEQAADILERVSNEFADQLE